MYFFTLASGSTGNCTLVATGSTKILIDGGISCAKITRILRQMGEDAKDIQGILLTHEHNDHVLGVEQFAKRHKIPVFASPKTCEALKMPELASGQIQSYTYDFKVGDIACDFFKISHDAVQPVGMVLESGGKRLGYATDTGEVTKGMVHGLQNLDAIVLECNHNREMLLNGPYAGFLKRRVLSSLGHLSNTQTAGFLSHILAEKEIKVVLAHLSETNNRPELAMKEVCEYLEKKGVSTKGIEVAPSVSPSGKIIL